MSRLPPHYFTLPTAAQFRDNPLSSELWSTWVLLRALSWINSYQFTPPISAAELADKRKTSPRTIQRHIASLVDLGWLQVTAVRGGRNTYCTQVPIDIPEHCDSVASFPPHWGEDSSGTDETAAQGLPATYDTGDVSTVVIVGTDPERENSCVPTTKTTSITRPRTHEQTDQIVDALWTLGIETDEAARELLALDHVTPEYVEDWVAHFRKAGQKAHLGGGYYRMQIRRKHVSPYEMTESARAAYRAENDRDCQIPIIAAERGVDDLAEVEDDPA